MLLTESANIKADRRSSGSRLLSSYRQNKFSGGFTLVELMVTLAIGFVLIAVGMPAIGSLLGDSRVTTQTNKFTKTIILARGEAVKRKMSVAVCSSTDQASCADSNDWSTGWIVFTDDSGTKGALDDTDTLLFSQDGLNGNSSFTTGVNSFRYLNTGTVEGAQNIDYTLSSESCSGTQKRVISIRPQGYLTVQKTACESEG